MATTLLLGFSTPQQSADASIPESESAHVPELARAEAIVRVPPAEVDGIRVVLHRPVSFARDQQLDSVLDHDIADLTWLQPPVDTAPPGTFHGVGFPNIRTFSQTERSSFDAPGLWAPLVSWRTGTSDSALSEPIARVRCMGLTPQAVAGRADRYHDMIYTYADEYAVSPHLVKAVIAVESCFNNKALSPVGAQGLMQLMPDTATWLKVEDSHDPEQNLRAGVRYLAALQEQFETTELVLAAYNAGPGNVRRYKGVPPFAETQAYVVKVQANYRRYKAAHSLLEVAVIP